MGSKLRSTRKQHTQEHEQKLSLKSRENSKYWVKDPIYDLATSVYMLSKSHKQKALVGQGLSEKAVGM